MDLKYAVLSYLGSGNYGDEIQSIAAAQCLPKVDTMIDRGQLNAFFATAKHVLLMNGYFGETQSGGSGFPPSDDIVPIYFSFHIAQNTIPFYTTPKCLEHFKKWEPIGCRDQGTVAVLKSKGIDAFFTKCVTLTLDKRTQPPVNGKLFIVDGESLPIPADMKKTAEWIRQSPHPDGAFSHQVKIKRALNLLARYRDEAELVITTRMHCALPCLAMGVPVILMTLASPKSYRLNCYSEIGGTLHHIVRMPKMLRTSALARFIRKVQVRNFLWQGDVLELEDEKQRIRTALQQQIDRQLAKL